MSSYQVPNLLVPSPFRQLDALLNGVEPGAQPIINMSIGAPQHALPGFVAEELARDLEPLSHYPAIMGTADFRQAIADWARVRYDLGDQIRPDHTITLNGSREGLFYAAFLAKDIAQKQDPVIIVPNPCYPTYIGAAKAAGCRIVTLPDTPDGLNLPSAVSTDDLDHAVAVYFHSPSNPQGAVATREMWHDWIEAARHHKFFLYADECYSELYRDKAPLGALQVALEMGGENPYERVVVLNSLSKRSNMPGVRAGFMLGDAGFITAFTAFRNVSGPQMPVPIQRVAIRALSDETHVAENRKLYNAKFDLVKQHLGIEPPEAGFFLWQDVGDMGGEAAAKTLWREAGIKSVPGAYLSYSETPGMPQPSDRFLRLAFVSEDLETTAEACRRIAKALPHICGPGAGGGS